MLGTAAARFLSVSLLNNPHAEWGEYMMVALLHMQAYTHLLRTVRLIKGNLATIECERCLKCIGSFRGLSTPMNVPVSVSVSGVIINLIECWSNGREAFLGLPV